nr:DUF58 domain-containing protein [Coralloluteibacterium stylophorae]
MTELIALRARVRAWPPAGRGARGATGTTSRVRGRGMDYAESRPYAAGDDARHIDWRLTARSGRAHTKIFHAERERVTLVVCDTAPAMYFGTRVCFKSVQAARAAALVAWAAQRSGDRIAVLRGGSEPPVRPAGGSRGALRALDAFARFYAVRPADDAGLDPALAAAGRLLHPGSRVVLTADAASLEAVSDARLSLLAAHHDLIVLLLADPLELAPPAARLAFSAGGERHLLDLAGASGRQRWQARFGDTIEAARARLVRLGAIARVLRTDESPEAILPLLLAGAPEAA